MSSKATTRTADAARSKAPLARYQSKRNFRITPEPSGAARKQPPPAEALPFVVQKHAARQLHYDFRLAWDGVLKSWAVAKGPSYCPADKRLAVQVEDHPFDYRDFEGTIPKGQYGGGTVMVWDEGYWTPRGDVNHGLEDGNLKFELHGKKLCGNWALVRMHSRGERSDKPNWLLIKERDEFARESSAKPIIDEAPNSAASGRSLEEIAAANDREWNSNRDDGKPVAAKSANGKRNLSSATARKRDAELSGILRESFPGFIPPQLAQSSATTPRGNDWLHELKLDGYRIQIHVRSDEKKGAVTRKAQLLTRKGLDWTHRMPDIADAATKLSVSSAIVDGEAVALDDRGISNFADLQAAFQEGREKFITYFAFDLLHLDGQNLRELPLSKRREILEGLIGKAGEGNPLRFSEAISGDVKVIFAKACELGTEGIVSKLAPAKYSSGRSSAWLKLKCHLEQEFVIGGFTLPSKGTEGVGALLLGYNEKGTLRYAGRAGTGFTQTTHRSLRARLDKLATKASPLAEVPRDQQRGAIWVKPEMVAQVAFSTWTRDGFVRQAAFKGLREDKPASEVTRETALRPNGSWPAPTKGRDSAKPKPTPKKKNTAPATGPAITHPEKVLDPESGMTKQDLAEYYLNIAGHLLPHVADRPLSIVRCPDGSHKPCFFQKHGGLGLPSSVKTVAIRNRKTGEREDYLTVNSAEGLVGLAQLGALEIHPWGSRNESLEKPDRIVFDLDPDTAIDWRTLAATARELKSKLSKVGLKSLLKSTGGKGLHVVIPIRPDHEWPVIKEFAHQLVIEMERAQPGLYVTKMTKSTRKNRIYLDYLRNDRGSTSIAAYSPRARPGAPVAAPLEWSELDSERAPAFHVTDFSEWKTRLRKDPWRKMLGTEQRFPVTSTKK
jgi:bifunctional non-homologous end joining protein LigD